MMLSKPSQLRNKISVLSSTKMADALSDAYSELHGSPPNPSQFSILENKESILSELDELDQRLKPLLKSNDALSDSEISSLKTYAKLQYEIGDYLGAANVLDELRRLNQRNQ